MHIIIEGIDKVGKTTLAIELAKRLYMPIINRMKPRDTIYQECMDFLNTADQGYIIDRLHISELAYGPVKRGKIRFTPTEFQNIEGKCKGLNTFNIFCSDSLENIKARCERMGEDFITGPEIAQVQENFFKEIPKSELEWHRYTIGDSIDELAEKIKKHFYGDK